jgi:hypothetical protein
MSLFASPARDDQGNELRRRRTDQMPFSIVGQGHDDRRRPRDRRSGSNTRVESAGRCERRLRFLVGQGAQVEGDLHTREAVVAGKSSALFTPASGWSSSPLASVTG